MNTVIIYSSKYGCTEECAEILKSKLSGNVTLFDIKRKNYDIELEKFDTIIIGSSIYVGAVSKDIRILCNDNIKLLEKKKVGIFLCCALPEDMDKYLSTNFPASLLKSAKIIKIFGGEARLDRMKFFDKLIAKSAIKGNYENLKISHHNIDAFIKELNE